MDGKTGGNSVVMDVKVFCQLVTRLMLQANKGRTEVLQQGVQVEQH